MSAASAKAIGIDFGGTSIKVGVCEGDQIIEKVPPLDTANHDSVDELLDAIVKIVEDLVEKHPEIVALGVGLPGFVDFDQGFVHNLTNVRGWTNIPLKHLLTQRLPKLGITVENDANAMAYAEWRYGAAQGKTNVVCVTLGTGVGGALILGGKLYRGGAFGAGEIGQMSIHYDGRSGNFGNLGALEKYVGNQQIEDHAIGCYEKVGITKKHGECTPQMIAEAAHEGDDIARQVWGDVAKWLANSLSSIVWLLNPDAIVVGGGVANAGSLLFEPLNHQMQATLNPVFWEKLDVVRAKFGNAAGIIGCASLAIDEKKRLDEASV